MLYTAETTGRAVVGGAALFGVGALCYYGLGLSNEVGAIDRAMVWPQVVRDRVRSTYTYFAGSLALTAGTAYAISQSRAVFTLMRASPWLVSFEHVKFVNTTTDCICAWSEPLVCAYVIHN